MRIKYFFTISLPIITIIIYSFIIYLISEDATNAIDENGRMVSTMILVVVTTTLIPTYWLMEVFNDWFIFKNSYIFYGITSFIQFLLIGLLTDTIIALVQKREINKIARENDYWVNIKESKMNEVTKTDQRK